MRTVKQKQSDGAKRAWRSRKALARARGRPAGIERVLAATTPDKSSAVIAKELGISASYVRECWRRANLPRRENGKLPRICNWGEGTE